MTLQLHDTETATALAELLYSTIDQELQKGLDILEDDFRGATLLLDFLASNSELFGQLSEYEVEDLQSRANNIAHANWPVLGEMGE